MGLAELGIENGHNGGDCDHGSLCADGEPLVEEAQDGVAFAGGERGHEQGALDGRAASGRCGSHFWRLRPISPVRAQPFPIRSTPSGRAAISWRREKNSPTSRLVPQQGSRQSRRAASRSALLTSRSQPGHLLTMASSRNGLWSSAASYLSFTSTASAQTRWSWTATRLRRFFWEQSPSGTTPLCKGSIPV